MYSYTIKKAADETAFFRTCKAIEQGMTGLRKEPLLVDVDGTQIQIYLSRGLEIKVVNDYEVDAVYVDSEVELTCVQMD